MHNPLLAGLGIEYHPHTAEIDLVYFTWFRIGHMLRDLMAAESEFITGIAVQCAVADGYSHATKLDM